MNSVRSAPSLTSVIHAYAQSAPERAAVSYVHTPDIEDGYRTLTYSELDDAARRLAVRLREELGLTVGDRVLLLYPSGVEFAIAFFGCLYASLIAVPAPMPGRGRRERLRVKGIVDDAGVRAILTDARDLPAMSRWVTADAVTGIPLVATDTPESSEPDPAALTVRPGPLPPAMLQYTSGSVSDPKGVVVSHANLLHNVDVLGASFSVPAGSTHGGWIPLHHDMGLIGHLLSGVLLGRGSVLMNPVSFVRRPHQWLRVIDRFNIGYSAAPNFAFELCLRRVTDEQLAEVDLSRWWHACNGSEPVHATTLREFTERFARSGLRPEAVVPSYGMAEATLYVSGSVNRRPVVFHADAEQLERHVLAPASSSAAKTRDVVSCGVLHEFDCRIVDPRTGATLPAGRIGEIWLRGPSVTQGYWDNPSATEQTFGATPRDDQRNGDGGSHGPAVRGEGAEQRYLRTGDLGVLRDDELYITGRIKETLLVNGRNLYPQDIEHELQSRHAELHSLPGAAFTITAEQGAPYDEALVVMQEVQGQWAEEEYARLVAAMKHTVSSEFGLPVAGVALLRPGSIQRTTSGKIQRVAMRELFLSDAVQPLYADW